MWGRETCRLELGAERVRGLGRAHLGRGMEGFDGRRGTLFDINNVV